MYFNYYLHTNFNALKQRIKMFCEQSKDTFFGTLKGSNDPKNLSANFVILLDLCTKFNQNRRNGWKMIYRVTKYR